MRSDFGQAPRSTGLVEILDRVLDKGLVVAGDIRVSLAEVELLTIRIRLIICSLEKAQEIGMDWWRYDHHFSPGQNRAAFENEQLKKQIRVLERRIEELSNKRGFGKVPQAPRAKRLPG